MVEPGPTSFMAECFWPGVKAADVRALDERARLSSVGTRVRFLGSVLMPDDEVVLCEFEGTAEAVRRVAESAGIPFDRIVETRRLQ
jgi:uncharacterized protein DUF4242